MLNQGRAQLMTVNIIIPARYKSSRFPGKPLELLAGKSLIRRSWEAAAKVKEVDNLYIATDDERIKKHAENFGGKVIMTSENCRNGTERVAEATSKLDSKAEDIIINFQGDAPLIPPHFVEALINEMKKQPSTQMATPALQCSKQTYTMFTEDRKHGRVGGTTVVFDNQHNALYFSKEVIPYCNPQDDMPVYHHVGLYAYRPALLQDYLTWQEGRLEKVEGLEQLRVLESGGKLKVVIVEDKNSEFWEVNNPEDIARVENILHERNLL
jgi:3-deoxy-manno-octulosonate cytidylyltransferase (CMP-KDO synthetase)